MTATTQEPATVPPVVLDRFERTVCPECGCSQLLAVTEIRTPATIEPPEDFTDRQRSAVNGLAACFAGYVLIAATVVIDRSIQGHWATAGAAGALLAGSLAVGFFIGREWEKPATVGQGGPAAPVSSK